jgi:tRNA pseudouridine38-40 synthase
MEEDTVKQSAIKYAVCLIYDGTAYYGWQAQRSLPSIESVMRRVLTKTVGAPLTLVAASRTDTQVHARGQIVMFTHMRKMDLACLHKLLNDHFPSDIFVKEVVYARSDFHPWYDVACKEYHYFFSTTKPEPLVGRYTWYVRKSFCAYHLARVVSYFVGIHSFDAFATLERTKDQNCKKRITSIKLHYFPSNDLWCLKIKGHSFLRHMIRRIVGAALYLAQRKEIPLTVISESLAQKRRVLEFPTAPGHGLTLYKITYHKGLQ